jgi:hypothetical protein
MATTQNTFTGNGSNLGPFSFTFKWLEPTDIKVTVAGVLKTVGTHYNLQSLNYSTKTGGQVLFTAGNAPANGAAIVIYRQTDDTDLAATFSSGSAIRAQDLNSNFTQGLYVAQEVNNSVVTANTTANTALTNSNTAISTANTASTNASAAVATANTASANASAAVSTANTASANATTAVNTANSAAAAVANVVTYTIIANVAAIPATPANNTAVEITNSTGIQSFTPLSGVPVGFVGSAGLSVRIIYSTVGSTWNWVQYFPNDPEARYLKLAGGNITGNLGINNPTPAVTLDVANVHGINNSIARPFRIRNYGQVSATGYGVGMSFFYPNGTTSDLGFEAAAIDSSYTSGGNFGNLIFSTNNNTGVAERARIDSSGRLLVGTSTARSNFFNTVVSPQIQLEGTGDFDRQSAIISSSSTAAFGAVQILAHQKSGSIGGNTLVANNDSLGIISFQGSDGTQFAEAARIESLVDGTPGSDDMPGRLVFSTTADGASSPTERMRIHANGYITYGTDNIDATGLTFGPTRSGAGSAPTLTWNGFFTGTTTACDFLYNGARQGSITTTTSATAYNTSSDYRLKENIEPLTGASGRLNQLQVHRFNFISDPGRTVDGFIAHEAQAVVPECVTGTQDEVDEDGNPVYQGIDQSKLVPLLTAALQEAIAEIESLKDRVAALEAS